MLQWHLMRMCDWYQMNTLNDQQAPEGGVMTLTHVRLQNENQPVRLQSPCRCPGPICKTATQDWSLLTSRRATSLLKIHKAFSERSQKVFFVRRCWIATCTHSLNRPVQDVDYNCLLIDHKSCDAPCSFKQLLRGVRSRDCRAAAAAAGKMALMDKWNRDRG